MRPADRAHAPGRGTRSPATARFDVSLSPVADRALSQDEVRGHPPPRVDALAVTRRLLSVCLLLSYVSVAGERGRGRHRERKNEQEEERERHSDTNSIWRLEFSAPLARPNNTAMSNAPTRAPSAARGNLAPDKEKLLQLARERVELLEAASYRALELLKTAPAARPFVKTEPEDEDPAASSRDKAPAPAAPARSNWAREAASPPPPPPLPDSDEEIIYPSGSSARTPKRARRNEVADRAGTPLRAATGPGPRNNTALTPRPGSCGTTSPRMRCARSAKSDPCQTCGTRATC